MHLSHPFEYLTEYVLSALFINLKTLLNQSVQVTRITILNDQIEVPFSLIGSELS